MRPREVPRTYEPYSASPAPAAPDAPAAAREGAAGAPDVLDELLASLATHGDEALHLARAELIALERPADMGTNALSWLGGRVSWHLRRAVLLDALRANAWNLTAVATALGMSQAGNVTVVIRELGLENELGKARARGLAKRGHKRTKGSK